MYLSINGRDELSDTCGEGDNEEYNSFFGPCFRVEFRSLTEVCAEDSELSAELAHSFEEVFSDVTESVWVLAELLHNVELTAEILHSKRIFSADETGSDLNSSSSNRSADTKDMGYRLIDNVEHAEQQEEL